MNLDASTIVCAVGAHGSPAAVDLAAHEAALKDARLHLVHVVDILATEEDERAAHDLLRAAASRARIAHPGLATTDEVVAMDWVAAALADIASDARLVVIEQTTQGPVHRFLSGSTADGVALKVHGPVLSAPHLRQVEASRAQVVTVGVQDSVEAPHLIEAALAEADARSAELVVLHAIWPGHGFDEADRGVHRDWVERAHGELDPVLERVSHQHPDVKTRIEIVHDAPADAHVSASTRSDLLVVGRHHHGHSWGTHLGPVVRRVLLDAHCPVLLPPAVPRDTTDEELPSRVAVPARRPGPEAAGQGFARGDIVVAIADADMGGALRFGVAEARTRGVGVHLVHVVRLPSVDDAVSMAEVWRDAVARGHALVSKAADQAREAAGTDVRVTTGLVERGGLSAEIAAQGAHAGAIVIQHRHLSSARRLITRSVTNGVAARAQVPVIAVWAGWSSGPKRNGSVVVGVQDVEECDALLSVAFDEAERRGLPLRVVHAGRLQESQAVALRKAVDALSDRHPDVVAHQVVEDRHSIDLLVGAMSAAELVVLGRRHHSLPRGSHLGPVARAVLDASTYPVMLVPPPTSSRAEMSTRTREEPLR